MSISLAPVPFLARAHRDELGCSGRLVHEHAVSSLCATVTGMFLLSLTVLVGDDKRADRARRERGGGRTSSTFLRMALNRVMSASLFLASRECPVCAPLSCCFVLVRAIRVGLEETHGSDENDRRARGGRHRQLRGPRTPHLNRQSRRPDQGVKPESDTHKGRDMLTREQGTVRRRARLALDVSSAQAGDCLPLPPSVRPNHPASAYSLIHRIPLRTVLCIPVARNKPRLVAFWLL